MKLGAHMSITDGLERALERGMQVECETVQIFTHSQHQWHMRPLDPAAVTRFRTEQQHCGLGPLMVHASYLINLASPDDQLWEKSIATFQHELERCDALAIPYLVIHPGAHTGSGEESGLARIAAACNQLFTKGVGGSTMVLFENTAGQGSSLGHSAEQLAGLLGQIDHTERIGVCIDTCHLFAAGYDFRTPTTYANTMTTFVRAIGLEAIKAFHLNDSVKPLGSRRDRHAHIGEGEIGLSGFQWLLNDARFAALPAVLETPKGDDLAEDRENLARLRGLVGSTFLEGPRLSI